MAAEAPVRVIDAFVDGLDVRQLGFGRSVPAATGRPPYDPRDLLKLYLYGYLNEIRSSRRLQRKAEGKEGSMKTVLIYVNTSLEVGNAEHLKVLPTRMLQRNGSESMTRKALLLNVR